MIRDSTRRRVRGVLEPFDLFYEDDMLTRLTVFLLALTLTAPFAMAQDETEDAATAETMEGDTGTDAGSSEAQMEQLVARASYAIGMDIANNMKQAGLELDVDRLAQGMRAAYGEGDPEMSQQEAQQALQRLQMAMQQQMQKKMRELSEQGEQLLEKNRQREEVTATESGLQYVILREGEGISPSAEDRVTVHYEGRTVDGEVFDSSYERGQPATFPLDGVIPGWSEGVALMQEGAKYKFWIPANLAYGERGQPQAGIGPNQVLIFDVELLEVVAGAADEE